MTLDEDAKKKSLSIMNILGPFMFEKKMLRRLIKTTNGLTFYHIKLKLYVKMGVN